MVILLPFDSPSTEVHSVEAPVITDVFIVPDTVPV